MEPRDCALPTIFEVYHYTSIQVSKFYSDSFMLFMFLLQYFTQSCLQSLSGVYSVKDRKKFYFLKKKCMTEKWLLICQPFIFTRSSFRDISFSCYFLEKLFVCYFLFFSLSLSLFSSRVDTW